MKISNHPLICIEPLRASSICVKHPIVPKMALQICNRLWIGNSRDSFSHVISLEIHATVFTVNKNQSKVERFLVFFKPDQEACKLFLLTQPAGWQPWGSQAERAEPSSGVQSWRLQMREEIWKTEI